MTFVVMFVVRFFFLFFYFCLLLFVVDGSLFWGSLFVVYCVLCVAFYLRCAMCVAC